MHFPTIKKYTEIYTTLNMEAYFAAKSRLADNSIPYRDTSTDNQLRLSFNNLRGDNVQLSRDGAVKNVYSLSVKKEDADKARQLLRDIERI